MAKSRFWLHYIIPFHGCYETDRKSLGVAHREWNESPNEPFAAYYHQYSWLLFSPSVIRSTFCVHIVFQLSLENCIWHISLKILNCEVSLIANYNQNCGTEARFISWWHVKVSFCLRVHVSIALLSALWSVIISLSSLCHSQPLSSFSRWKTNYPRDVPIQS